MDTGREYRRPILTPEPAGGKYPDVTQEKMDTGTVTFRSVMGTEEVEELDKKSYPVGPDGKKLKPCCACPETKRARDACVLEKGQENCSVEIEAHKACMRSMGFNI